MDASETALGAPEIMPPGFGLRGVWGGGGGGVEGLEVGSQWSVDLLGIL